MPLIDVSGRLSSPEIDRIISPFREKRASLRRLFVILMIAIWNTFWATKNDHFLSAEALHVLPYTMALLATSTVWATLIYRGLGEGKRWPDVAGTIADFVGIGLLLSQAWNLMLPLVGALPLACVTTGARFKKPAFQIAVIAAMGIVLLSAPDGYWASRPAVAALAMMLIAGIPVTFNRVLNGLWHVSEQAISAKDAQARFLAMMSHELRTPLNTVIHAAQLVGAYPDEVEQGRLRNSIITNANVLLGRVNDVLDVATAESPESTIAVEPFDLRSIITTVDAVVRSSAEDKQIMLAFMYDKEQSEVLRGDARRIEQVITNLTSNAIKYTENGGSVTVTATTSPVTKEASASEVQFTVADTGIGIPDEHKNRIFEPFQQVSVGDTRLHSGVGLGLHIVKLISDRLNGKLTVADNVGGGTVFTWILSLPYAADGTMGITHTPTLDLLNEHKKKAEPLKCLVVDDNLSNRDIMGRVLSLAGHEPEFAVDGEQCLVRVSSNEYDIVFLDLHMPGMSGLDVLRSMNSRYRSRSPRTVILTASTDARASKEAMKEGAIGVLSKPLSIPILIDTLEGIQSGETLRKRRRADHSNPLTTMRQLTDPTSVRAFLHITANELKNALDALLQILAHEDPSEQQCKLALHRLKNALINAGVDSDVLDKIGFTEANTSRSLVLSKRHEFERLTMVTIASIQSEPEFA